MRRKNKKLEELIEINADMYGKIANWNVMNKQLVAASAVACALRTVSRNTRYQLEVDLILEEAEKYLYYDGTK